MVDAQRYKRRELMTAGVDTRATVTKEGERVILGMGTRKEIDSLFEKQEMKLVPCRWSRTGWKYAEE